MKPVVLSFHLVLCAVIGVFGLTPQPARAQSLAPGTCISAEGADLLARVNAYRQQNGLAAVPVSRTLMTVAQWHARDATLNGASIFNATCNLHSWSNTRPELWSGGCYTSDHANREMMWNKPAELSGGAYASEGFENAAQGYASPAAALAGWQGSPAHNQVILNQGGWAQLSWRSIGVGIDMSSRYYFLWFGYQNDPQGTMQLCSAVGGLFGNGFEG
jgi:hypothetical protein